MADGIDQIFGDIRGAITSGVVVSVEDGGQAQVATIQTADGVVRANVEVLQPFGFASVPPANGTICLVLAVGGDPANLKALPLGCPSARFGQQNPGEATLYADDGTRVRVKQGGVVDIWGGTQINLHTNNVTISAPNGVAIEVGSGTNGVMVTGDLLVSGSVIEGYGTGRQVGVGTHTHDQPVDSHGDTEQATLAPNANT